MTKVPIRPGLVLLPSGGTPADRSIEKRRVRKHSLLNVIRQHGPLSRAEISKLSGFNGPSVSSLVEELVADKLVLEESARETSRGRPPVPVRFNGKAASVVGIDIGWSSTIGVLLDLDGNVLANFEASTSKFKDPGANVRWILKVIDELIAGTTGEIPPICGVGISTPGLIPRRNPETDFEDKFLTAEIRNVLSNELEIPVLIDNDARMMAIGSFWFGVGKEHKNFGVLNVGYGLGFGMVLGGKPVRGARGFAGEIGHIPFGDPDVPCSCGRVGCIQNIASGEGLARMAGEAGLQVNDVKEIFDLARAKNEKALAIVNRFSDALARALSTIFTLYDPATVIISGRVSRSSDVYLDRVIQLVQKFTLPQIIKPSRIVLSELDVQLGSLGAAASILHRIFYSSHVEVDHVI